MTHKLAWLEVLGRIIEVHDKSVREFFAFKRSLTSICRPVAEGSEAKALGDISGNFEHKYLAMLTSIEFRLETRHQVFYQSMKVVMHSGNLIRKIFVHASDIVSYAAKKVASIVMSTVYKRE